MTDHHVGIEGVRMIIVEFAALLNGQLVIGPIVIIVAEHGDIVLKAGDQVLHQRCFAAAAAACDAQHNDIWHSISPLSKYRAAHVPVQRIQLVKKVQRDYFDKLLSELQN